MRIRLLTNCRADEVLAEIVLDIDIINKVEVIVEVSLMIAKGFRNKSGEVSEKRACDERRLVKTT